MHVTPAALSRTVLLLGNVTEDRGDGPETHPGGAVYYAAAAAASLGWQALCVTRAASAPPLLSPDLQSLVTWHVVPSDVTTAFRNVYDPGGSRKQQVLSAVPGINAADVPPSWRRPGAVHLAPVARELDDHVLADVECQFVGVGVQGWLRQIDPEGNVLPARWSMPADIRARCSAAAVSEEDLAAETRSVEDLAGTVPILAVTRGVDGASIIVHGHRSDIASRPTKAVDPTGAGDVFAATFFLLLAEGRPPTEAALWAVTAASFSVEAPGTAGLRSREEIAQAI